MTRRLQPPSLDQRRAQWLKGVLDLCALAALRDGEVYGYELAQSLEAAGLGPIKGGTLYPLLRRLDQAGLVATTWRASSQGPDRKYYRLTDAGVVAAREATAAWLGFVESINALIGPTTPKDSP